MNLGSFLGMALLGASLVAAAAPAAGRPETGPADAFAQNKSLGRGVNILGYDPFWEDESRTRWKDGYFELLREAGFASVRVNLHPFKHMDASLGLSRAWLEKLDRVVAGATGAGLMVILDLHEFNALAADPEGNKPKLLAFWRQVAPRYRDAPSSVLFELVNEPAEKLTAPLWNAWLPELLALVRETNPGRTVILGPASWNSLFALGSLRLPPGDRNIIVTVHYYLPMEFTHQGAEWTPQFKGLSGIPWKGTEAERQVIRTHFEAAEKWAKAEGRPLFLGEFGAYDKADMDSRARYTAAVARTAESLGWSWAYWQFDADFVLYDVEKERWIEPLLEALTGKA